MDFTIVLVMNARKTKVMRRCAQISLAYLVTGSAMTGRVLWNGSFVMEYFIVQINLTKLIVNLVVV